MTLFVFHFTRYGGKHVLGLGMLLAIISTLLIPVAARLHVYLVIVLRVLMGLGMVRIVLIFVSFLLDFQSSKLSYILSGIYLYKC